MVIETKKYYCQRGRDKLCEKKIFGQREPSLPPPTQPRVAVLSFIKLGKNEGKGERWSLSIAFNSWIRGFWGSPSSVHGSAVSGGLSVQYMGFEFRGSCLFSTWVWSFGGLSVQYMGLEFRGAVCSVHGSAVPGGLLPQYMDPRYLGAVCSLERFAVSGGLSVQYMGFEFRGAVCSVHGF